nr:hypothetical protein BaRGS_008060 [Batillaria attramentaria]
MAFKGKCESGEGKVACRTCGTLFTHTSNLLRHRKKCEGRFNLACHLCGQRFYRRDHYQEHLAHKHGTVDVMKGKLKLPWVHKHTAAALANTTGTRRETFTCRTCNKVFLHQCNLLRHRKKCEGDFHLTCQVCGMMFYRRDVYQNHLADKHHILDEFKGSRRRVLPKARPGGGVTQTGANKGRATYSCRTCGKVFLHQCNLFRHRKKCEGDFHLTCHVCGMKFYRRDHYQGHLAYKHQTVDVMKGKIHARHGQPRQQPPS